MEITFLTLIGKGICAEAGRVESGRMEPWFCGGFKRLFRLIFMLFDQSSGLLLPEGIGNNVAVECAELHADGRLLSLGGLGFTLALDAC